MQVPAGPAETISKDSLMIWLTIQEDVGGLRKKSESDDMDLEVGDMDVPEIEIPDINLEADFDVPDVDFNVSDI